MQNNKPSPFLKVSRIVALSGMGIFLIWLLVLLLIIWPVLGFPSDGPKWVNISTVVAIMPLIIGGVMVAIAHRKQIISAIKDIINS